MAPGRACVEGVPQRRSFFRCARGGEGGLGNDDHKGRSVLRPATVELIQQAQKTFPVRRVTARVEKTPRLRVVSRRSPARRFEEAQQGVLGNALAGEGTRGPAIS